MAKKAKVRKAKRATKKTSSKKAKAVNVRKAKTKKAGAKKAAVRKGRARSKPDIRIPISGDPDHEILCKWNAAANQYDCKQVPVPKARARKTAKKAVVNRGVTRAAAAAGMPNKRVPISGDPYNEILCKWDASANQYDCRQVPIGGNW